MNDLMQTNIYAPEGVVLIAGSCLAQMQPEGFAQLAAQADCVYSLCLESTHINMAITKISALLSTGRVTRLMLATVDRSPHCTQLHYVRHELERVMTIEIPVEDYVVVDNTPLRISEEAIERSKTLSTL